MSSQDVLEKLFEVERKAEELVAEARAEAGRRVTAAKEGIERERAERCDAAARAAKEARERAERAIEAECRGALDSYKAQLEAAPVDERAFVEACERELSRML